MLITEQRGRIACWPAQRKAPLMWTARLLLALSFVVSRRVHIQCVCTIVRGKAHEAKNTVLLWVKGWNRDKVLTGLVWMEGWSGESDQQIRGSSKLLWPPQDALYPGSSPHCLAEPTKGQQTLWAWDRQTDRRTPNMLFPSCLCLITTTVLSLRELLSVCPSQSVCLLVAPCYRFTRILESGGKKSRIVPRFRCQWGVYCVTDIFILIRPTFIFHFIFGAFKGTNLFIGSFIYFWFWQLWSSIVKSHHILMFIDIFRGREREGMFQNLD